MIRKCWALSRLACLLCFLLGLSGPAEGKASDSLRKTMESVSTPSPFGLEPLSMRGQAWVKETLHNMSLSEKIGQLFMLATPSTSDPAHIRRMERLIAEYHIGGLLFLKGGPIQQRDLIQHYQQLSKFPLLMATDAENGLGMRMDSLITFPHQLTLGAIQNNQLIYQMGLEIARQCRLLGIHLNFAPVLDVNDNPRNPVINERSFGDNRNLVALKGIAYMKGLQDGGLLAVAKHFPGHGDSDQDSHLSLPTIERGARALDSIELYPFKSLIQYGLSGIMTGHLFVPSLDPTIGRAASLSRPIVTGLLRQKLNFQGLVITDAMNMKGAAEFSPSGRDLMALEAGNDMLLFSEDLAASIRAIYLAIGRHELTTEQVDEKVRHILTAKFRAGLSEATPRESGRPPTHRTPVLTPGALRDQYWNSLSTAHAGVLNRKLFEASLTLLGNRQKVLPFRNFENQRMAVVSIGEVKGNTFQRTLNKYGPFAEYSAWIDSDPEEYAHLLDSLQGYQSVVIALHNLDNSEQLNFGIRQTTLEFIHRLHNRQIVLVVFGNPYLLTSLENIPNVLVAYEDNAMTEELSAEVLFGAISPKGKLPVRVSTAYRQGDGVSFPATGRLKYTPPEELGLVPGALKKVDSIAEDGVRQHAYPGCVVLAVKDGKVFYEKAFGTHTYTDRTKTQVDDVFDLASVTKITSTVLGAMKLVEQGLVDLNKPLSTYLPDLSKTNKGAILVRDLLTHEAGLVPYIPFYREALKRRGVFSPDSSTAFSYRVASHFYQRSTYFSESMWPEIVASPLKTPGKYVYSDLSMYFMRAVLEKVTHQDLKSYVTDLFYKPLGLSTMGFNPRTRIPISRIMPTENDTFFRKQLLIGDVHDQGAAMQNGVGGHAGLFSDASDLATLGQMLLNEGTYAGRIYLKPETVRLFNTRPNPKTSRRGLGFDKPELQAGLYGAIAPMASSETFGHTGFTGTCIWIDPKERLIYVFLSNRVCPDADNNQLSNLSIRPKIQAAFYEALASAK